MQIVQRQRTWDGWLLPQVLSFLDWLALCSSLPSLLSSRKMVLEEVTCGKRT